MTKTTHPVANAAMSFLIVTMLLFMPNRLPANEILVGETGKCSAGMSSLPERWYLPTVDGKARLFIYELGSGEPIVVLHGGPGQSLDYMLDLPSGLENTFHFIFYDQRGSFYSRTAKENISMEKHVEDLETLRKSLGLEKMNLLSHSAGTYLVYEYLQKYPNRVKNIILTGAIDPVNGIEGFFSTEELAESDQARKDFAEFILRDEVNVEIKKAGLDKSPDALTEKEKFQLGGIRYASANVYNMLCWKKLRRGFFNVEAAEATRASTNFMYDRRAILAKHEFPITVINGEFDYVVGPKGSPTWKRVIKTSAPNIKLVVIEKAGHNSWYDAPLEFQRAVREAMNKKQPVE